MNKNQILTSISMLVFLVIFVLTLVFFSYLFLIVVSVGLILLAVRYIRMKFFQQKMKKYVNKHPTQSVKSGRTIDHDSS